MNKYVFIIVVFLSVFRTSAEAQDDPFDPVIKAFKASDAGDLAPLFNATVELRLPDNENTYSASQTEMILKDFFKKYPSDSFTILEKGSTDATCRFAIGDYSTGTRHFQVYIYMRDEKGRFLIHKIRVDEKK
jgi:hypothetical protein